MFDTYTTVVGNVLHDPEERQTANTGAHVTTFKIASTARRMDRQTGKWIDGNSLRVRVSCWRALGANVRRSVRVGDPVVVYGRLFTRDWTDEQGQKRLAYELEAMTVGHDLSRGKAVFERGKPRTTTSAVEDADADQRVGGEPTELVSDGEAVQFDDTPFEAIFDRPAAVEDTPEEPAGPDVPQAQEEPADPFGLSPAGSAAPGPPAADGETDPGRRRGTRRSKVPA